MSEQPINIAEGSYSGTNLPIDVIARASPDITTSLSAAVASSAATSISVASGALPFPQSGSFMIRVGSEEMLVTAGQGTTTWTVTRGVNGTTALASIASGTLVALLTAVQRVEPVFAKKMITYHGRASTFQIPGRAGTVGQKLFSIFNTNAAPNVIVDVGNVLVDLNSTAAKTVQSPIVRLYKVTAAPTNGSAVTKMPEDSTLTSNANVALLQDASADNTGSTTTLTSALTAGNVWSQVYPSQLYTIVGFSSFDAFRFCPTVDEYITLNAGEGMVVMLDYAVATANPITERWAVEARWMEYTNA